jgi:hypothetical protein
MVGPQQPPQIYPLDQPTSETDPRFTLNLVLDVADVLTKHGYPDMIDAGSGADILALQSALFRVIYGPVGATEARDPDPSDPLGILNGSHVSNCPVNTDPNPVPADCICVG